MRKNYCAVVGTFEDVRQWPDKPTGVVLPHPPQPHMSKDDILKRILADFRRICAENADDPMVKSTVQTLNDTKVVKKEWFLSKFTLWFDILCVIWLPLRRFRPSGGLPHTWHRSRPKPPMTYYNEEENLTPHTIVTRRTSLRYALFKQTSIAQRNPRVPARSVGVQFEYSYLVGAIWQSRTGNPRLD